MIVCYLKVTIMLTFVSVFTSRWRRVLGETAALGGWSYSNGNAAQGRWVLQRGYGWTPGTSEDTDGLCAAYNSTAGRYTRCYCNGTARYDGARCLIQQDSPAIIRLGVAPRTMVRQGWVSITTIRMGPAPRTTIRPGALPVSIRLGDVTGTMIQLDD